MPKRVSKRSFNQCAKRLEKLREEQAELLSRLADLEAQQAERERLISSVEESHEKAKNKLRGFFETDEEAEYYFHKLKTSNSVDFESIVQKYKSRIVDPKKRTSRKQKSDEPAEQPSKKLKVTRSAESKEIKGNYEFPNHIHVFNCIYLHNKN